jgi:hypothetical protein
LPETGIKKQSPRTPKIPVDISPRKASTSNISTPLLDTDAPDPVVLDMDTDDEDSRGIGFLSCASSSAPPSKRRRVILSSDEEDEAPMPKFHQEEKEKKNTKNETTPTRRRNLELESREKVKQECHDKMDISQDEGMQTPKSKSKNSTQSQHQKHISEFTHSFIDSFVSAIKFFYKKLNKLF